MVRYPSSTFIDMTQGTLDGCAFWSRRKEAKEAWKRLNLITDLIIGDGNHLTARSLKNPMLE